MMRADAGLHADPTRRQIGESGLHLATRPLLPQHDGTALILANDVERVLADINADYGGRRVEFVRHGVLLVFGAPCQLRLLAGQEHGRTIPLADFSSRPPRRIEALGRAVSPDRPDAAPAPRVERPCRSKADGAMGHFSNLEVATWLRIAFSDSLPPFWRRTA